MADGSCKVVDNGRGIPVDPMTSGAQKGKSALEVVLTVLHAGGKFGGGGYKVSGGSARRRRLGRERGVDAPDRRGRQRRQATTSSSSKTAASPRARSRRRARRRKGRTGTTIQFWPDPEIFKAEGIEFRANTVLERLQTYAFLNKDLEIRFKDERPGHTQSVTYRYAGGIVDYVKHLNATKEALFKKVASYEVKADDYEVEIAMQWNTGYHEGIHSFANGIETPEGGTHEEGFRKALTNVVNKYARSAAVLEGEGREPRSAKTFVKASPPSSR